MGKNSGEFRLVKECSVCKRDSPLDNFLPHPLTADGLTPNCVRCGAKAVDDWVIFNFETPTRQYGLSAAAILNNDDNCIDEFIGRIGEINPVYLILVERMAKRLYQYFEKAAQSGSEG